MSVNDRLERLPKWARDQITQLERQVATLTKRIADIPEDDAVAFTDAYGYMTGRRRPVAKRGEAVRFYLEDASDDRRKDYIEVTAHEGFLSIMCDQQLLLLPQATNVARAEVRPR